MKSLNLGKWGSFTVEMFAVIFGVLIAFWVENIGDRYDDLESRQFYYTELMDNLQKDQAQIVNVIDEQFQIQNVLLKYSGDMERIESKVIDREFSTTIANTTFYPTKGAYRAMISEGSLDLIPNKKVTSELVQLYEFNYERCVYLGGLLDAEVARIMWETKKYYSLVYKTFFDPKTIHNQEFKSLLEHRIAYVGLYLEHLEKTKKKIDDVIDILKHNKEELTEEDYLVLLF